MKSDISKEKVDLGILAAHFTASLSDEKGTMMTPLDANDEYLGRIRAKTEILGFGLPSKDDVFDYINSDNPPTGTQYGVAFTDFAERVNNHGVQYLQQNILSILNQHPEELTRKQLTKFIQAVQEYKEQYIPI